MGANLSCVSCRAGPQAALVLQQLESIITPAAAKLLGAHLQENPHVMLWMPFKSQGMLQVSSTAAAASAATIWALPAALAQEGAAVTLLAGAAAVAGPRGRFKLGALRRG
jgi:hypothetical protein